MSYRHRCLGGTLGEWMTSGNWPAADLHFGSGIFAKQQVEKYMGLV